VQSGMALYVRSHHGVQQEPRNRNGTAALFGKYDYRTYHCAAAVDHETHGIDVELAYMSADVFRGAATTNYRRGPLLGCVEEAYADDGDSGRAQSADHNHALLKFRQRRRDRFIRISLRTPRVASGVAVKISGLPSTESVLPKSCIASRCRWRSSIPLVRFQYGIGSQSRCVSCIWLLLLAMVRSAPHQPPPIATNSCIVSW
jgi:hypothetical protein